MFFDLIFQIEFSFLGSLLNINLCLSYIELNLKCLMLHTVTKYSFDIIRMMDN